MEGYDVFLLFLIGAAIFAFALIYALRLFSKKSIKIRLRFASLLSLIALIFILFRQSSFVLLCEMFLYSIPISGIIILFLWEKRDMWHQKVYKHVGQIIFLFSLFFWRWLHMVSLFWEGVLVFVVGFSLLFFVFFSNAQELEEDFKETEMHG